jgi:hypothetical protein
MKTKLLYVWLEPDRVVTFCTEAKRRRVSVDVIVSECIAKLLEEAA